MNLNLAANSVGFYQLSKLACIPVTLLFEKVCYNRTPSLTVFLTLLPLLVGVGIGTVSDVTMNFIGTTYALLAVLAASLAQIFTSNVQKEQECDAMQLLYHTSPLIVLQMVVATPMFHNMVSLVESQPPLIVSMHILLSCVLAFGVNVSNYMVLGLTSPLTYQVLGHLKTILILFIGSVTFKTIPTPSVIFGMSLAVFGGKEYTDVRGFGRSTKEKGGSTAAFSQKHVADQGYEHSYTHKHCIHTMCYTITFMLHPHIIHTVVAYTEMKRRESHSASSKVSSSKGSSQPAIAYEPVPQHPASHSSQEKERDGGQ
jgi:solute carrier family 35 protein E3